MNSTHKQTQWCMLRNLGLPLSSSKLLSGQPDASTNQGLFTVRSKIRSSELRQPKIGSKVFIPEMIQVVDILPELNTKDILTRTCYFGKYGEIVKTELTSSKTPQQINKRRFMSAYITYSSQLDAVLALVAMQYYTHGVFHNYCNPATSKFCHNYFQKGVCTYKACSFLHHYPKDYKVYSENHEEIAERIKLAKKTVVQNLRYFIEKAHGQLLQKTKDTYQAGLVKCSCQSAGGSNPRTQNNVQQLPSIQQVFAKLIQQGLLIQSTYNRANEDYQSRLNTQKLSIKTDPTTRERDQNRQDQSTKLTKEIFDVLEAKKPQLNSPKQEEFPSLLKQIVEPKRITGENPKSKLKVIGCNQNGEKARKLNGLVKKSSYSKQQKDSDETNNLISFVHQKILENYSKKNPFKSRFFDSKPDETDTLKKIKASLFRFLVNSK